ncbi:MAG: UDP-4-amino-4,6-dideoxy-N-acetyl-beta-L-altrosamine transaminase [bacterium]
MPKKSIPYSTQFIDKDDIKAVAAALLSNYLTQGPKVAEFEEKVAGYCGAKYAVAFNSGTSALHGACSAAGIGHSNEVITSPITFVASANCVVYCGGTPVFADVEPDTALISVEKIKRKITSKTKAIIPVDYAGHPCDMDSINKISRENKLIVIEDAAHSLGAEYKGKKVGTLADMTILSFHAVKHITTGEGGMILTDNKSYYDKLIKFRTHGITRAVHSKDPWYYEMQDLGYNYRLTDIQCALGISQLKKLDKFLKIRRDIANRYNKAFADIEGIGIPVEKGHARSSCHLYPIRLNKELVLKKRQIFQDLRKLGIGVNVHYIPVPLQPYYRDKFGYKKGDFPHAEAFYQSEISLPLHQKMTKNDVDQVIQSIKRTVNKWRDK